MTQVPGPDGAGAWRVRPFLAPGPDGRAARAASAREEEPAPGATPRPFLLTAGRTRGAVSVALEAQVLTTPRGQAVLPELTFEYRDIVAACEHPLAVAEVAARLRLHVGVARVLIGDLTHQGLVMTYEPSDNVTHDVGTILRVIDGLRRRTS